MKSTKYKGVIISEKVDNENGMFKYSFFSEEGFTPGEIVYVVKKTHGRTKAQNDLFWSAMRELYKSGAYSFLNVRENPDYPMSFKFFSDMVKLEFGAGAEYYIWRTKDGYRGISEELPVGDFLYVEPIPKSTTKYTKEEFSNLLANVGAWVREMGDIPDKIFKMLHMIEIV